MSLLGAPNYSWWNIKYIRVIPSFNILPSNKIYMRAQECKVKGVLYTLGDRSSS